MITREELSQMAKQLGFNLYQAEKDYLQHVFLASLYSVSSIEFAFKGGTAIQKAHGLDRFSEDLDFTFNGEKAPLDFAIKAISHASAWAPFELGEKWEKELSFTARLRANGPLYGGTSHSRQALWLEVSLREKLMLSPEAIRIVPLHASLSPYVAQVMQKDEMLSEKVRAIMSRNKPRDVYDAWFLLKKGARPNQALIDGKLSFIGKKFSASAFRQSVNEKEKGWKAELGKLMKNVPGFAETSEYVIKEICG